MKFSNKLSTFDITASVAQLLKTHTITSEDTFAREVVSLKSHQNLWLFNSDTRDRTKELLKREQIQKKFSKNDHLRGGLIDIITNTGFEDPSQELLLLRQGIMVTIFFLSRSLNLNFGVGVVQRCQPVRVLAESETSHRMHSRYSYSTQRKADKSTNESSQPDTATENVRSYRCGNFFKENYAGRQTRCL